jgi:hypothetical protein
MRCISSAVLWRAVVPPATLRRARAAHFLLSAAGAGRPRDSRRDGSETGPALLSARSAGGREVLLTRRESVAHLAFDEERVGERARRSEFYFIFGHVADERATAAGMMRGRFSGLEKNANIRSSGEGAHCSNWRW